MLEFDIFEIMYPVVEERDKMLEEKLKQLATCHFKLIKDYNILRKEYDRIKKGTSNKNYDILELKYWEAQRTIDKYAAENEELKNCKKDLTRWREMYYDLQKERDEFENKLLDTEDKLEEKERELKETQKYLVGYQKLYYDEVVKNKKSDDRGEEKTLDIYDLEDSDGEDDDNKS